MTLTEVSVSAAVLGIGVMGLAEIQTTSVRAIARSESSRVARQLAQQRLEWLATKNLERIASCPGPASCRAGMRSPAPLKSAQDNFMCTRFVDGPTHGGGNAQTGKYRIDVAVSQPQGSQQYDDARVLTIAVCYTEASGVIREVQAERLVVEDQGDQE